MHEECIGKRECDALKGEIREELANAARKNVIKALMSGIGASVPIILMLIGLSWSLSSQLTTVRDQQMKNAEELRRIEEYLKIPSPYPPPRSYTLPEETPFANDRVPRLPQVAKDPTIR